MSRFRFVQTIALFLGIVLKNWVQLAFLADGRRRARKVTR